MKKQMMVVTFATLVALGLTAAEIVDLGKDWQISPVAEQEGAEGSIIVNDIPVYAMPKGKTPAEIKKLDAERGTFDGKNVFTVKAGSGQSASTFYLRVSKEEKPDDVKRHQVKELDEIDLYPTSNPTFDPYEFVYW